MTTNTLDIAPGLTLDVDYVAGASMALLGKRGAGKTYACRVLAEGLVDAGVQTVIIDPMGVFWGLRSSAAGDREGLSIPVFGGSHADAPLEPTAGALMADLVVEERLSMVLDLSGFTSRTQERSFVAAFLDRLYRTHHDGLVHLIVDEIDLFAPQRPRREDAHLLVTMENIVRRGRNKGIGISAASQRAAVVHKDVLTQADALIALRVTAPQDRDAIRDWVRGQGDDDTWSTIGPSLPSLANGEGWWWIPELGILQRAQVRPARTFDSSPTRRRGQGARAPKTFADVDLDAITERMAATIERAKASDPRELTRRIRELERELAERAPAAPAPTVVEVPILDPGLMDRLEEATTALTEAQAASHDVDREFLAHLERAAAARASTAGDVAAAAEALTAALAQLTAASPAAPALLPPADRRPAARPVSPAPPEESRPPRPPAISADGDAPAEISPARRRILDAIAELETLGVDAPRKTQVALWAGVSPKSSGYANNLGALRTAGLLEYPTGGRVTLTADGRNHAAPPARSTSEAELHRQVQGLLTPARWRIVEALIAAHPDSLDRAELADTAGVSAGSSGYANNLGALRTLGLLDYPTPGRVIAAEVLFLTHS